MTPITLIKKRKLASLVDKRDKQAVNHHSFTPLSPGISPKEGRNNQREADNNNCEAINPFNN